MRYVMSSSVSFLYVILCFTCANLLEATSFYHF
jgi:hypothetical protein